MYVTYDPISNIIQYSATSIPDDHKVVKFVANITERDALGVEHDIVWVLDATDDPTVDNAGALYGRDQSGNWVKLSETESMDLPPGLQNPMTQQSQLIIGGVGGEPLTLNPGSETQVLSIKSGHVAWDYVHVDGGIIP